MARFRVTVVGLNLKTLAGKTLGFRVVRTIEACDPLVAGERALSVVRADRALKDNQFDPWHPPTLYVDEVTELPADEPIVNSAFEWT